MNTLEKCAEILVERGYASGFYMYHDRYLWEKENKAKREAYFEDTQLKVNPFADTLEGRRQADAIEDWLMVEHYARWYKSKNIDTCVDIKFSCHQWRLDRIKWCIEELNK